MKQASYQDFISKPEISFWVPIIISLMAMALTYGALLTRISLVEQKMDTMIDNQQSLSADFRSWKSQAEARLGTVESRQNTVMSHHPEIYFK